MNRLNYYLIFVTAIALFLPGCSRQSDTSQSTQSGNKRPTGSITASPNPITVCGKNLTGITTLSWTTEETTAVEVRVNSPAGPLFSSGAQSGKATTGDWVVDGQVFYLQDASNKEPPTPLTTIATVTVKHTKQGCQR